MRRLWFTLIVAAFVLTLPRPQPAGAGTPAGISSMLLADDDEDGPAPPPEKPWQNLVFPGALIVVAALGFGVRALRAKRR